jgi:hypothetical protein
MRNIFQILTVFKIQNLYFETFLKGKSCLSPGDRASRVPRVLQATRVHMDPTHHQPKRSSSVPSSSRFLLCCDSSSTLARHPCVPLCTPSRSGPTSIQGYSMNTQKKRQKKWSFIIARYMNKQKRRKGITYSDHTHPSSLWPS